jgi:riboflavin synthase
MFTGLVEVMGTVTTCTDDGTGGRRLAIHEPFLVPRIIMGESIAVNGACLTVMDYGPAGFTFQVGPETLAKTTLGELVPGAVVNLERAMKLGDRVGGHLVQGHVDGVAQVLERVPSGEWEMVWFSCPPERLGEIVPKGSITVDGVSLTVVAVRADGFQVMLIPHTLVNTTLGNRPVGTRVNLETDILAKYVARQLEMRSW